MGFERVTNSDPQKELLGNLLLFVPTSSGPSLHPPFSAKGPPARRQSADSKCSRACHAGYEMRLNKFGTYLVMRGCYRSVAFHYFVVGLRR